MLQKQTNRIVRDLILKVAGQDMSVQRPANPSASDALSYALILKPPSGDEDLPPASWTLQAQCRRGAVRFAPSVSTFGCISALEQGRAVSGSVALRVTEQNCPKATPNPSIERPEGPDVAVLEVLEPSAHCGVEPLDDGIDAVPGPPWRGTCQRS